MHNPMDCMPLRVPANVGQCTSDHIMSPCEEVGLIYASKISGFRADSTQAWILFSKFWLICWNWPCLLFIFEALLGLYFKLHEHEQRCYFKLCWHGWAKQGVWSHWLAHLVRGRYMSSDHTALCQLHHLKRLDHWGSTISDLVIACSCH